jgi:hypothetical protein
VLIVVGLVLAQVLSQMGLVPDEGAVQELAAASPDQRSVIAFMRGVWMLQSTIRMSAWARTASNAAVKFDPRSRIPSHPPGRRDRLRHRTDPPKTRPGRPDQRIHPRRLTPENPQVTCTASELVAGAVTCGLAG